MSLIEVLIAGMILSGGLFALSSGFTPVEVLVNKSEEEWAASAYAIELMEHFRSHSTAELVRYLRVNPFNGSITQPYPFCAHIGLWDRTKPRTSAEAIINPDPLANIPSMTGSLVAANRYYRVNVVNAITMEINPLACEQTPATYALRPNERLLVTVGVSWVSSSTGTAELRTTLASTLLPN